MKISKVHFTHLVDVPGLGRVQDVSERTTQMSYDHEKGVLWFDGTNCGVPAVHIDSFERANEMLVCPDCQQEFINIQGLSSHSKKHRNEKGAA